MESFDDVRPFGGGRRLPWPPRQRGGSLRTELELDATKAELAEARAEITYRDIHYTFSFWASAVATVLVRFPRTRVAGAYLLLLVGYGGVGVAWERTCLCDLRRLKAPPRKAITGVLTHLPLAVAGHAVLRSTPFPPIGSGGTPN